MPDKHGRFTACVDFDGVLNNYQGWKGVGVFEEPVPGASAAMTTLKSLGWIIIIHTTRIEKDLITIWLQQHGIPFDYINEMQPDAQDNPPNPGKPPADLYIDDRAFRFNGDWEKEIQTIITMDLNPWGKKAKKMKLQDFAGAGIGMKPMTVKHPVGLPRLDQVAFLVRDAAKVMDVMDQFGMKPKAVDIIENTQPTMLVGAGMVPVHHRLQLVFYDWHGMELEFLQVLEGETRHNGMLQDGQFACLSHLGAHVDNIDDWVEKLGYPVIQKDDVRGRWKYSYLGTANSLGFDLKLIQRLYDYKPSLDTSFLNLAYEVREKMIQKKSDDYLNAWEYCGLLGAMAHVQKKFFLLWNWIWYGKKPVSEDAQSVRRELMDLFVYSGIALTCHDQNNQDGRKKWD